MTFAFCLFLVFFSIGLHELGHAWAMHRNGIPIKRIGFGISLGLPSIDFKLSRFPGIQFSIGLIPLGAFVEWTDAGGEMVKRLPWKKKFDVFGYGPLANLLFGLIVCVIAMTFANWGNLASFTRFWVMLASIPILFLLRKVFARYIMPVIGLFWFALIVFLMIKSPTESVSGPVGIATIAKQQAVDWTNAIFFGGYISLMIGLFNCIPVYPLDGGKQVEHMLSRFKSGVNIYRKAGFVAIIAILVLAFTSDFIRLAQ